MKIRHLVHSCLLVEGAGRRILVDPGGFSADAVRALPAEVRAGIDVVALTHQHPDHIDPDLLREILEASPRAVVVAEPETAALLRESDDGTSPERAESPLAGLVGRERLQPLAAGEEHDVAAADGASPLRIRAVGGRHAVIHPDLPQIGNTGLVISAGGGPRLGITGDSLEPVQEFHGIDALAFAVVAPWSKMAETIDFLRAVNPTLALPVHEAVSSDVGRPIYLRQATNLAPDGTEVRDWPADGVVEITGS